MPVEKRFILNTMKDGVLSIDTLGTSLERGAATANAYPLDDLEVNDEIQSFIRSGWARLLTHDEKVLYLREIKPKIKLQLEREEKNRKEVLKKLKSPMAADVLARMLEDAKEDLDLGMLGTKDGEVKVSEKIKQAQDKIQKSLDTLAEEIKVTECSACGTTNPYPAKFCMNCGVVLPKEETVEEVPAGIPKEEVKEEVKEETPVVEEVPVVEETSEPVKREEMSASVEEFIKKPSALKKQALRYIRDIKMLGDIIKFEDSAESADIKELCSKRIEELKTQRR